MAKKSSKTAHVLNLISPSKAEEPVQEAPAVQNTAADPSPAVSDTPAVPTPVVPEVPVVPETHAATDTPAAQDTPVAPQAPVAPEAPVAPQAHAPAPTPVSTAEKSQEPPKSKPKAETMEGILHLSENTENLSLLIRDNLEKEFSLQNPPPKPFWGSEGVPIAENPHAVVKEVAPANVPLAEPLTAEPAFAAESPLPEMPFLPAEPEASEPLPVTQEPLDEPILPIAQEPLDEPILPVAQELLDEPVLPVAQEPLDEPILPVAQEPLDEPVLPVVPEETEKTAGEIHAESEPVPEEPEDDGEPAENKQFCYTNVYERIIKSCVMEYLERFGVCTCSRCVADTTALALTNLPSKYIVTDFDNVEPLLSLYESKFEVAIMTELTKACFEVDAHPHHKI